MIKFIIHYVFSKRNFINKNIMDQKRTLNIKIVVKLNVDKRVFLVGQAIYHKTLQAYIHIAQAWIYQDEE